MHPWRSILRLRLAVALILPFACSVPNPAIAQPRDLTQYTHTAWRTREVPMKYGISRMAQTPDGYLWLGAYDGIYRFDGVRFARWEPPNGQQLPKQYITSLTVTRDGTLWIGATEGLASWKDGKLTRFDYGKGEVFTPILERSDGSKWFVTSKGSVCTIRGDAV